MYSTCTCANEYYMYIHVQWNPSYPDAVLTGTCFYRAAKIKKIKKIKGHVHTHMLTRYAIVIHTLGGERMEVTKLGKRKRRVVSLKTKLEIIGELKTGKSQRVVASDFEIPSLQLQYVTVNMDQFSTQFCN